MIRYAIVSIISLAIGGASVIFTTQLTDTTPDISDINGRTVAQLIALPDTELEKVDIVEMNIAVAREIPGLEKLDYTAYRKTVDAWADQFSRWLPTTEHAFRENPTKYKNDINFFRIGMLAQFLDQQIGVAYVESQKRGVKEVWYTNPGHLLLHGLIDTKRGTCATMPALHVAIARRLGWPVALACVKSHYVSRYDDGKIAYNIESTDTGKGGFAAGSNSDYMKSEGISSKAVSCGSDLRKLTAREMLGVFIQSRGRHLSDTKKPIDAAADYALAHTLFPKSRKIYANLAGCLVPVGEKLFTPDERGHPYSLGAYLAARYHRSNSGRRSTSSRSSANLDINQAIDKIDAINRRKMQRHKQNSMPPVMVHPQPYQPPMPGVIAPPVPSVPGAAPLPKLRR
ncbi:MAG: hypothetical protein HN350_06050 [Phycisphaerales bacterium]|nr:hypothetical protein [Phycisphaerales bacterium]